MLQVIGLDDFDFIEHLRIEWVVIHGEDHDSTLSAHFVGIVINVNQHQNVFHDVKTGDSFCA